MSRAPLEKRCCLIRICYVVTAYRPYQTKKGHYVWRKHEEVVVLSEDQLGKSEYRDLAERRGLHNVKLTEDEVIRHLAEGQP